MTSGIPIYTMQSMKLPQSICSRLDKFLIWHDDEKEENWDRNLRVDPNLLVALV